MNSLPVTGPFLVDGNPDTSVRAITEPSTTPGQHNPHAPGQIGMNFTLNDKRYATVKLDSGATSATPVGAVAANQLAFWKDKAKRVVTNDKRFADVTGNGASNRVAGVFRSAITPGAYGSVCNILTQGADIPVKSDGSGAAGATAVADTTASVSRVTSVAAGTASTYIPVGVIKGAANGGNINVDVDIPTFGG